MVFKSTSATILSMAGTIICPSQWANCTGNLSKAKAEDLLHEMWLHMLQIPGVLFWILKYLHIFKA